MTGAHAALLAGLFLAPALLLWLGHRLRSRPPLGRRVFWGAAVGHTLAVLLTVAAAMYPPVAWEGGAWARGFAVHWSMLLGAVLGGAAAALAGRRG